MPEQDIHSNTACMCAATSRFHIHPENSASYQYVRHPKLDYCTLDDSPAPSSKRAPPIASTSSKKMRQAFLLLAIWNSSRTILAPSPTYFCTSSLPMTLMKHASVLFATARASRVFPASHMQRSNMQKCWQILLVYNKVNKRAQYRSGSAICMHPSITASFSFDVRMAQVMKEIASYSEVSMSCFD